MPISLLLKKWRKNKCNVYDNRITVTKVNGGVLVCYGQKMEKVD
ncbi:desulfoferrodoxin [Chloroflexota bacterium]